MKRILVLSIFTFLLSLSLASQLPATSYASIERTFFSISPELYMGSYRNLGYNCNFEYWYRPGTAAGRSWAIKRIDPLPEIYPTPTYMYWNGGEWETAYDPSQMVYITWGNDQWSFLFTSAGTYIFRWGVIANFPSQGWTNEDIWNNLDSVGVFDQDTVTFTFGTPDAELHIVQPCKKEWLPVVEGYIDSTGHPNTTDFIVPLKGLFTSHVGTPSYRVRWVLTDISWYKAACMNWPPHAQTEGPPGPPNPHEADLKILEQYNPRLECYWDTTNRVFYATTPVPISSGDTVGVNVTCYDFGAHGRIFMEALSTDNNLWYNMTKYMKADSTLLNFSTIPIDEDNYGTNTCGIADYWKELRLADPHCPDSITTTVQIEATQDFDDYLHGVLPCELGDYLNTFEEYRGFYCRGVHTRTSPWAKDFFVYSDLDSNFINTGLGYATEIGPGLAHLIDSTEMQSFFHPDPDTLTAMDDTLKSINWYADRIESHANCPCIIVLNNMAWDSTKTRQALGEARVVSGLGYAIPKTTDVCYIYTRRIKSHTPPHFNPDTLDLRYDSLCWKSITGHEIGHTVNMGHNTNDSSIMVSPFPSFITPPNVYLQADLDSFLVKPRQ
jgi:hypothetical protein